MIESFASVKHGTSNIVKTNTKNLHFLFNYSHKNECADYYVSRIYRKNIECKHVVHTIDVMSKVDSIHETH